MPSLPNSTSMLRKFLAPSLLGLTLAGCTSPQIPAHTLHARMPNGQTVTTHIYREDDTHSKIVFTCTGGSPADNERLCAQIRGAYAEEDDGGPSALGVPGQ